MKLTIVDKAFIPRGHNYADVLEGVLRTAQLAESAGYHRYWVTEHHHMACSHSSPDVMVSVIAGATSRIRVGSAGMLMLFHSPWRVAEAFRLLEALYPGRIDLGVAAGGAGSPDVQQALSPGFDMAEARANGLYARQVERLMELAGGKRGRRPPRPLQLKPVWPRFSPPAPRPDLSAVPSPADQPGPPVILLGAGPGDRHALFAARHGRTFCYLVSNGYEEMGLEVIRKYRDAFCPSEQLSEPEVLIAGHLLCAETTQDAARLLNTFRASFQDETATVIGRPERCRERIQELLDRYGAREMALFPLYLSEEDRLRGLAMLAEAAALDRETVAV